MILWRDSYPGIYVVEKDIKDQPLGFAQGHAFVRATFAALDKISSRPVGKDLLSLISKRCRGVGTKVRDGKVVIHLGPGTLTSGRATIKQAIKETFANPDEFAKIFRASTPIPGTNITLAGHGSSSMVGYNPFVSLDVEMRTQLGVETPAFVALAHELCHSFHFLSGDLSPGPNMRMREEARTVGAGRYANTRISENAIRKEHGIGLRQFYDTPGDCNV